MSEESSPGLEAVNNRGVLFLAYPCSPPGLRPSPLLDLRQDYHTLHRRIVINAVEVYTKISKD
jgi:hypothetical protein